MAPKMMSLAHSFYCCCFCYFVGVFLVRGTLAYDPESSITGLYTGPYFDPLAKRNLSAHLGERATLPCTVRQLGDKSVSWVRMRDADILTVDRYTFVGDERFESHFSETRETWSLIIKYVQERDAGLYECQVSTEPKMSQLFNLRVVVPKVEIIPPGDRYMKAGSRVQIDCHIKNVVMLPDYIFWYHGDVRLMENKETNILVTVKRTGPEAITSTLTILEVPAEATGNYTCMPSNLHASSVNLHVLNEKNPEAMQGERNNSSKLSGPSCYQLLFMLFLVLLKFESASLSELVEEIELKFKPQGSKSSQKGAKQSSVVGNTDIMLSPKRAMLISLGIFSPDANFLSCFPRLSLFPFSSGRDAKSYLGKSSLPKYFLLRESDAQMLTLSNGKPDHDTAPRVENGNGLCDDTSSAMDVSG
ncbi:uncharacterized protein LOC135225602 [Macrobrachium nipponense]|uniref:uncharacterized protein LOC135225602 n=1 Tax=Macrobrachium nipponense TaxID=159736 RepID=UPI0030C7D3B8